MISMLGDPDSDTVHRFNRVFHLLERFGTQYRDFQPINKAEQGDRCVIF